MKKRFRTLVRGGWHVATIPPNTKINDEIHYKELRSWCAENVSRQEWEATMSRGNGGHPRGEKRFAFKNVEDKLIFALRWA